MMHNTINYTFKVDYHYYLIKHDDFYVMVFYTRILFISLIGHINFYMIRWKVLYASTTKSMNRIFSNLLLFVVACLCWLLRPLLMFLFAI